MLTSDELSALRERIPGDPDLTSLLGTLLARSSPLLACLPHIPSVKALLSRDGGFCPEDGATLSFDPWSPEEHRCPRCSKVFSSERHYLNWARAQHLWLAERTAELALIGAITDNDAASARANEILGITAARSRSLAQPILGVAGIIQTIPSIALLVLLIRPMSWVTGEIGRPQAIVALFLYSLLPIVRNTYTGLHDIPSNIRESAEALGLSYLARLRLIELPMASRSIIGGWTTIGPLLLPFNRCPISGS